MFTVSANYNTDFNNICNLQEYSTSKLIVTWLRHLILYICNLDSIHFKSYACPYVLLPTEGGRLPKHVTRKTIFLVYTLNVQKG